MKRSATLVLAVATIALLALSSPVAAQPDVTVTVDGEEVEDGETVQVDSSTVAVRVSAESDTRLTRVRTDAGGSYSVTGLDRSTYNETQTVTVIGETVFSVEVTEDGDETYTHEVTLTRSTDTANDAQQAVDNLQDRVDTLQGDVEDLEDRRNSLRETNENLTRRLNQTDNSSTDDGSGDGGGEGMPGFGVLVAFAAFGSVAAMRLS